MTAHRIQLRRAKGWRMPANTVKVDRSTRWGNPFTVADMGSAEEAVYRFEAAIIGPLLGGRRCPPDAHPESYIGRIITDIHQLRGKNLACWCPLDQPCHADALLRLANDGEATP